MAALAEASDANYYYVEDVEKLAEVFAQELGELQSVVDQVLGRLSLKQLLCSEKEMMRLGSEHAVILPMISSSA